MIFAPKVTIVQSVPPRQLLVMLVTIQMPTVSRPSLSATSARTVNIVTLLVFCMLVCKTAQLVSTVLSRLPQALELQIATTVSSAQLDL